MQEERDRLMQTREMRGKREREKEREKEREREREREIDEKWGKK